MGNRTSGIVAGLIVLAVAVPARGQSAFASATAFANLYRPGGFEIVSPYVQDENMSGDTAGGGIGVGAVIGSHAIVQVEVMLTGTIRKTFGPTRYLPPIPQPPFGSMREVELRTRHGAILAGYRTATRHRLSAAFLGGVMFLQERTRNVARIVPPSPPFQPPSDTTSRFYRTAPVVGLDVTISVFSRLAVVPQMRVYKSASGTGALGMWPGMSLRWTF